MRATREWENNGYIGVSLGLTPDDIDSLVSMLLKLKSQPDQHFHLSSKYEEEKGVGDSRSTYRLTKRAIWLSSASLVPLGGRLAHNHSLQARRPCRAAA